MKKILLFLSIISINLVVGQVRIPNLPVATSIADSDYVVINKSDSVITKIIKAQYIKSYVLAAVPGSVVYAGSVTIDSAEFKAANGTTGLIKTLIATPNGSTAIDIISIDYAFTYILTTYNGTATIGAYPANLTPNVAGSTFQASTTILAAGASRFLKGSVGTASGGTVSNMTFGQDIKLCFTTPGSKPTIGGGSLTIYFVYRLIVSS